MVQNCILNDLRSFGHPCILGAVYRVPPCDPFSRCSIPAYDRRPSVYRQREFLYLYHAVEAWLSVRHSAGLYRGESCTSICQNRSDLEVKLSGVDGVVV